MLHGVQVTRLLVCVDLDIETAPIVEAAVRLAGAGGELHLLHVAEPEPEFVGNRVDTPELREIIANKIRDAHRAVEALASDLVAKGVNATAHLARGAVPATILERAERLDASAIVIGSSREHRLRHLVQGSITDAVLRKATLPIVVVPIPVQ
jgi:nucleotide-binding universal stress UspA family protein